MKIAAKSFEVKEFLALETNRSIKLGILCDGFEKKALWGPISSLQLDEQIQKEPFTQL